MSKAKATPDLEETKERQAIFLALGNQKGGVGKSTSAILLSTYLTLDTDLKICLYDCDKQQSAINQRINDLDFYRHMHGFGTKFNKQKEQITLQMFKKPLYDIKPMLLNTTDDMSPEQVLQHNLSLGKVMAEDYKKYDLIIIDLPGNLQSEEMAQMLNVIDIFIVPVDNNDINIVSAIAFHELISDLAERKDYAYKDNIYFFYNKLKTNEKKTLLIANCKYVNEIPDVKFLRSQVQERANIKDLTLLSMTKLPEEKKSRSGNAHFEEFVAEVLSILEGRWDPYIIPKE